MATLVEVVGLLHPNHLFVPNPVPTVGVGLGFFGVLTVWRRGGALSGALGITP